jgi:hypothetical protein
VFFSFSSNAQQRFYTTTSTTYENSDIYHGGKIGIGDDQFSGDISISRPSGDPNIVLSNSYGTLYIAGVSSNGAYAPAAVPGDFVFKRLGDGDIIFNLSTTGASSNGSRKVIFGDRTNQNLLVVSNIGKVGIGTEFFDSDDYMLYVKKGIKTEEIKVELCSGWCDYVFTPNYNLLPLSNVQQFINEKGHLPNMPSEEQLVEDGGFEVGKMTKMQQEKIEELFLYIIELNEKIEALEGELAKQKSKK